MNLFVSVKMNCYTCYARFNFINYPLNNDSLDCMYSNDKIQHFTNEPTDEVLFKVRSLGGADFNFSVWK